MIKYLFTYLIGITLSCSVFASFESGLEAFKNGNYKNAEMFFSADFDSTHNINALYNLGICSDTLGNKKKALFFFEKTLKYKPDFSDAIYNAQVVQEKINADVVWKHPYTWIERFMFKLSTRTWVFIAIFSSLLIAICIYLGLTGNSNQKKISSAILLLGIVSIVISTCAGYFSQKHNQNLEYAYFKKDNVKSYLTPNGIEQDIEKVAAFRFPVIEEKNEFLLLQLNKTNSGWVNKKDLMFF